MSKVRRITKSLVKELDKLRATDRGAYEARLMELAKEQLAKVPKLHSKDLGVEIGIVGIDPDGNYVDPTSHETAMYRALKTATGVTKATKGKADWKLTAAGRKAANEQPANEPVAA